jgi:hypothetical protein
MVYSIHTHYVHKRYTLYNIMHDVHNICV